MNAHDQLMKFKERSISHVNRMVFIILLISCPCIPIAIGMSTFHIFHFSQQLITSLLLIFALFDVIPILMYLFKFDQTFFMYYTMSSFAVLISFITFQTGTSAWLMYAFAPIMSCLYFRKQLTFFVTTLEYVTMMFSLFLGTHYNFDRLYSHKFSTPSNAFCSYGAGLTIEFAIVVLAIYFFLQRIDEYFSIQNKLIDEISKEKERFQIAVADSSNIIIEYDMQQDCLTSTCDFFQFAPNATDDVIIPGFSEFIHSHMKDYPSVVRTFQKLIKGKLDSPSELHFFRPMPDGSKRECWMLYEGKFRYDTDQKPLAIIGKLQDITSTKKEQAKIRDMEKRDKVTGLYLFETAEAQIKQNEQILNYHGLILLRAVNYHNILEIYGHVFGEMVLRNMAELIREITPSQATISRYENSTFLIYMEISTEAELQTLSSDLKEALSKLYIGEGAVKNLVCETHTQCGYYPFHQLFSDALKKMQAIDEVEDVINTVKYSNRFEYAAANSVQEWIEKHAFFNTMADLIEETKDLKSSIRMVIEQVGKYLKLDRIYILNLSEHKPKPVLMYQWFQNEEDLLSIKFHTLTPVDMEKFINLYSTHKILDLKKVIAPSLTRIEEQYKMDHALIFLGSQLTCPLIAEGDIFGCIFYDKREENYKWTDSEQYFLEEATRIINNELNKL